MDSSVLPEATKTESARDPVSCEPAAHAMAKQTHEHEDLSGHAYLKRQWSFEDYCRAYRFGAEAYHRLQGRSFDDAEPEMKRDWERVKVNSNLPWEHAKYASRDAWQRGSESLERACLGDSEQDEN